MKNSDIILSLFCFLLVFSCTQSEKTNKHPVSNISQSNLNNRKSRKLQPPIIDSIIYANGSPTITPLPFGPNVSINKLHKDSKFFERLIYKNVGELIGTGWTRKTLNTIKIYRLPQIKKIHYIGLSYTDTGTCNNGKPFGDYLNLTRYRYRLPDIGVCQCYYWCDYDPYQRDYSEIVRNNCRQCFLDFFYGYFILYTPQIQEATVIPIYFDVYRDGSGHDRNFLIDKQFKIHLVDFGQEEDDGDGTIPSQSVVDQKRIISISNNGKIIVEKIK